MPMDKINIATLDINVSSLVKSTAEAKRKMDEMKAAQKDLKKSTEDTSEEFVQSEVVIKRLSKEYTEGVKALAEYSKKLTDQENRTELLTVAMNQEITSIDHARANIKLLTDLRNATNVSTKEGADELKLLNAELDKNNDFVKENADSYLKLKLNIGNYAEGMKEALDSINPFNGGLSAFIARSEEAGGAGNLLKNSFNGIIAGLRGMITAGLAFIATPIGAVIAALAATIAIVVGSFKFMATQMNKTEAGANKLSRVMSIFTGILNAVFKALKPLAEFIFNVFVKILDSLVEQTEAVVGALTSLLRAIGLDGLASKIDEVTNSIKENVKMAQELADAEAKLTKMQREARLVQLQYMKDAEKLRQLRDDEARSIPERIASNTKLGQVLKAQLKDELDIANQALKVANLRIKAEGESTENLDERAKALTEIADIQERITGQESEQLANLNSLRKEAHDKEVELQEKLRANALAVSQAQLELLRQGLDARAHSVAEQIKLMEEIAVKSKEVAQKEFETTKKTEADKLNLKLATNEADIELAKAKTEAIVAEADRQVELFRNANAQQLEDGKVFNQELLNQKIALLEEESRLEKEAQQKRFEENLINEQQLKDALLLIDQEDRAKRLELQEQSRTQDLDRQLIDLENQRMSREENFFLDMQTKAKEDEIRKAQELAQAETTGADKSLIEAKYAQIAKDRDKAVAENKLEVASSTFSNITAIVGKESSLGKALAVTQATIDTYKGAVSAYSAMAGIPIVGPVLGAAAAGAVIASGVANVKKITSTPTPKAEKGAVILGGNSHSNGGTPLFDDLGNKVIEAQSGEALGILNRNATSHFMDFNNAFNRQSVPSFSTSGGSISQSSQSSVNLAPLGAMFAEAVSQIPPPVVAIEDINYMSQQQTKVMSNGDLG